MPPRDTVELVQGDTTVAAEVLCFRRVAGWTVAWVRPAGGADELVAVHSSGRYLTPLQLARRVAAGEPVHEPVAVIERVLAVTVLALAAELEEAQS